MLLMDVRVFVRPGGIGDNDYIYHGVKMVLTILMR